MTREFARAMSTGSGHLYALESGQTAELALMYPSPPRLALSLRLRRSLLSAQRLALELRKRGRRWSPHHLVHTGLGAGRCPPLTLIAAPNGEHHHRECSDGGGNVEDNRPFFLGALLYDPFGQDLKVHVDHGRRYC